MLPAWPASSHASKAARWSGGLAGPIATRSKPSSRPFSLIRRATVAGVNALSGCITAGQDHESASGERPSALGDEVLPGRPPSVVLPAGAQRGGPGEGGLLRRKARDVLLHVE